MKMKRQFHIQGSFAAAFSVLTGGVFLSGLAAMMGAGDVLIGYISVIMNICGALILFFAPYIERFKSRKKVTLVLTVLSKIVTALIVFIPVAAPKSLYLFIFLPLTVIAFSLQAQAQVSLNNWLVAFVEEERRGRYISVRMTAQLMITVLLSVAAGYFIDTMEGKYIAFVLLFCLAFAFALLETVTLLQIDDVQTAQKSRPKYSLKDLFRIPFQNKEYIEFVVYIASFYFLLYISDSFTIVYLLKYLTLSFTEITIYQQLFMSLPQIFLLSVWGRISDKRGHNRALHICIWFFAFEVLFVMFSSKETALVLLPLAYLFGAIANSGFSVSVFNRRYELIPDEGRIIYDNFFSAAVGVSLILGPVTGGTVRDAVAKSGVVSSVPFGDFRALYALSFIGILMLQLFHFRKRRPT